MVDPDGVVEGKVADTWKAEHAHHGVAVPLDDGGMVTSVGTDDERTGAQVLDADGEVVATSTQCPGVHGEGTAEGEIVVFG